MTKKLSIAGLVVAAAASSAIAFGSAPAKAACIGGNNPCTTFDPSTISTPTNVGSYTGSPGAPVSAYTHARFQLVVQNLEATGPFEAGDLILNLIPGASNLNLGKVNFNSNGTFDGAWTALSSNVTTAFNWSNATISYTIPSGLNVGTKLFAVLQYAEDSTGSFAQTSASNFLSTATNPSTGTPAPLPLLGAGAALGFSRRLRKQIKQVA